MVRLGKFGPNLKVGILSIAECERTFGFSRLFSGFDPSLLVVELGSSRSLLDFYLCRRFNYCNFDRLNFVTIPSAASMNPLQQGGSGDISRLLRPLLPAAAPRTETQPPSLKRARVSLACAACRGRKTKVARYPLSKAPWTSSKTLRSAMVDAHGAVNASPGGAIASTWKQRRRR